MAIFVFAENINGKYSKAALEAVSYAKAVAESCSTDVVAVAINPVESSEKLYEYGVSEVIKIVEENLKIFNAKTYAEALKDVVSGSILVLSHTNDSVAVAAMYSVMTDATLISNIIEIPVFTSEFFEVKRKAFTGKATMTIKIEALKSVLTVAPNSYGIRKSEVEGKEVEKQISVEGSVFKVLNHEQSADTLDLKSAEVIVSGGRGLKGAENWGILEDLAGVLNAALACTKPVSDMGWREHAEHVGQTGKAVSPNLYIAVGISGAIQHVAGMNTAKTIVVINNDPEAPFFKVADYGVVGDAFEVIPKLTEKIREAKNV